MRETSSEHFRDHFLRKYLALEGRLDYQRHLRRLLFGTLRDTQGRILVGQPQVAEDIGPDGVAALVAKRLCAIDFLSSFQAAVFGPDRYLIHGYVAAELVRTVELRLDDEDQILLLAEYRGDFKASPRVYFVGGERFNRGRHSVRVAQEKAALMERLDNLKLPISDESKRVIGYLNTLPVNLFTRKVQENWEAAYEVAVRLEGETQLSALRSLRGIEDRPQPLYRESTAGHTDRVFGLGANLQGLKREVRKTLLKGWTEADLSFAQLACAARLWNIEEIQTFLIEGGDFWGDLIPYLLPGIQRESSLWGEVKAIAKVAVYGIIFGMRMKSLRRELKALDKLGITVDQFVGHWAIQELLTARERVRQQLEYQEYGETIFGKRINVVEVNDNDAFHEGKNNVGSIMAEMAQALELALILPIFDLAMTTNEFKIAVYLFDGVVISFKDAKREKKWRARISEVVGQRAQELGVCTSLKWSAIETPAKSAITPREILPDPPREVPQTREELHQEVPVKKSITTLVAEEETPPAPVELRQEEDGYILTDDPDDIRFFNPDYKIRLRNPPQEEAPVWYHQRSKKIEGEHEYGYRRFDQHHVAEWEKKEIRLPSVNLTIVKTQTEKEVARRKVYADLGLE